MNVIRRLILLVGFLPMSIYALLRWIATGKDASEVIDNFIEWSTRA